MLYTIESVKELYDRDGKFVKSDVKEEEIQKDIFEKDIVAHLYQAITHKDFYELEMYGLHKLITFRIVSSKALARPTSEDFEFILNYGIDMSATLENKAMFADYLNRACEVMLSLELKYKSMKGEK